MNKSIYNMFLCVMVLFTGCVKTMGSYESGDAVPRPIDVERIIVGDVNDNCGKPDLELRYYLEERIGVARYSEMIVFLNEVGNEFEIEVLRKHPADHLSLCEHIGHWIDKLNGEDGGVNVASLPGTAQEQRLVVSDEYKRVAAAAARSTWWGRMCGSVNVKDACGVIPSYRDIRNYIVFGSYLSSDFNKTLWDLRESCIGQSLSLEARDAVGALEEVGWVLMVYPYLKGGRGLP